MEQLRLGGVPTEVLYAHVRFGSRGWSATVTTRLWGSTEWVRSRYDDLTASELAQVLEAAEDRWRAG
jgi:hypothetical protein